MVESVFQKAVIVQVLEGENAVAKHREILGATTLKKPPLEPFELTSLNL